MTDIEKKFDDIISGIKATQEKADALDKKYDILDVESKRRAAEATTEAMQAIQDVKAAQKATEEMLKNLEGHVLKAANSGGNDDQLDKKWSKGVANYLRKGKVIDDALVKEVCADIAEKHMHGDIELKTLQELNNPDGGYWLRRAYSSTMIKRIFETSPVRQYANIETTVNNSLTFPIDDNTGISGGWVSETGSRAVTGTPQVGQLEIFAHEQYASPQATQALLDDAGFDVESWVLDKGTDIFTRTENTAFVSGSGSGQPKGFLSYSAWTTAGTYERGKIEQVNSGSAANFTGDGIKNLQNSLIEDYQANAVFMLKRASFSDIIELKDGQGRYLLNTESMKQGDTKILLGKEVVFAHDIPAIAANALAMVYGDFKRGYTIVDRIGVRVLRDPYTAKPFVIFYMTKRVGGDVTSYEALKIQKLAV